MYFAYSTRALKSHQLNQQEENWVGFYFLPLFSLPGKDHSEGTFI